MDQQAYIQRFQKAAAAAQSGDFPLAMELANAMLAQNPNDPNALQILGLSHARMGRSGEALTAYQKADKIAPNQPPILNSLGALLKLHGDLKASLTALQKAIEITPGFTEAHYNLATAYIAADDRANARQSFERAVATNPNHAEALSKYAAFLEGEHEIEKARELAERALALQPQNAGAHLTLAEIDARQKRHQPVIERLRQAAPAAIADPQNASLLYGRLAKSLEALARYDEAYDAFTKANDLQKTFYADFIARENSPRSPENLRRLRAFFDATDMASWSAPSALEGQGPIFLVGFPRSGTTLLDQILSSHPQAHVLEEKENLIDAWKDFVLEKGALDKLPALSEQEINRYRTLYWRRVEAHGAPANTIIIDKLPLDTALLGLIYRFFPDAKIIFALRDPRDAVLSCFQQTFAMNAAMYQFLSLETAARYYDQVMSLGALYGDKTPLQTHYVRYEHIVDNLRLEIEPLLAFLGLPWDENVMTFYETAKQRAIRTPSAKQVIQKPYASSIGKWKHYQPHMAPVLPVLNKWVEAFDYSAFPAVQ